MTQSPAEQTPQAACASCAGRAIRREMAISAQCGVARCLFTGGKRRDARMALHPPREHAVRPHCSAPFRSTRIIMK